MKVETDEFALRNLLQGSGTVLWMSRNFFPFAFNQSSYYNWRQSLRRMTYLQFSFLRRWIVIFRAFEFPLLINSSTFPADKFIFWSRFSEKHLVTCEINCGFFAPWNSIVWLFWKLSVDFRKILISVTLFKQKQSKLHSKTSFQVKQSNAKNDGGRRIGS